VDDGFDDLVFDPQGFGDVFDEPEPEPSGGGFGGWLDDAWGWVGDTAKEVFTGGQAQTPTYNDVPQEDETDWGGIPGLMLDTGLDLLVELATVFQAQTSLMDDVPQEDEDSFGDIGRIWSDTVQEIKGVFTGNNPTTETYNNNKEEKVVEEKAVEEAKGKTETKAEEVTKKPEDKKEEEKIKKKLKPLCSPCNEYGCGGSDSCGNDCGDWLIGTDCPKDGGCGGVDKCSFSCSIDKLDSKSCYKEIPCKEIAFCTELLTIKDSCGGCTDDKVCKGGLCKSSCTGEPELTFDNNIVLPEENIKPQVSGLTNCAGKTIQFREGSCSGNQKSSCVIGAVGTGCTGGQFQVPQNYGTVTYYACII
jgi:hypothetical protein